MNLKKSVSIVLIGSILCLSSFLSFEGAVVKAVDYQSTTTSTVTTTPGLSFNLDLELTPELRLMCPSGPIAMGSIPSMTGGTANTSADCNVMTNNPDGYTLWVHASSTDTGALASVTAPDTSGFENHPIRSGAAWVGEFVLDVASSTFGFTASSTNGSNYFKSNSGTCGTDQSAASATGQCWRGFEAAEDTDIMVANSTSASATVAGVTTTLSFQAYIGNSMATDLPVGDYQATIVVTGVQN